MLAGVGRLVRILEGRFGRLVLSDLAPGEACAAQADPVILMQPGDADLMFDWTLVGRDTLDTGRFFFSAEERFRFASAITPAQLAGEIGALTSTAGPFNDRGLVIRDAFWDQRFLDARLRILAGRAAPDDYVGSNRLAGANFQDADLEGARFARSDLRGANLRGASLTATQFFEPEGGFESGARLEEADLSGAYLDGLVEEQMEFLQHSRAHGAGPRF